MSDIQVCLAFRRAIVIRPEQMKHVALLCALNGGHLYDTDAYVIADDEVFPVSPSDVGGSET